MLRRTAVSALLLAAAASCGGGSAGAPAGGHRARSVVLFTVDTLRADHLGCYGNAGGLTPSADGLARQGLLFQSAYTQASHTHAAVSSMLTGLYPHHTGVLGMSGKLAEGVESVAQAVQRAGIATGSFASSHCSPGKEERTVWHDGWDTVFCTRDERTEHGDWDREVTARAIGWMDKQEGPFFCWIHLFDPHGEHIPPPRHWTAGEAYWEKPEQVALFQEKYALHGLFPTPDELALLMRIYAAEVQGADDQLGRVLAFLDQRKDRDDIAVIFSADHGEELFDSSPRYGHGRILTEAVLRVPLIIRAPGVAPGVVDQPVETLQVAPTIFELFDLPLARAVDGGSLLAERPSRGFAVSYYGSTVTIRHGALRGWLNSDGLPPDPMASLYENEDTSQVPWFATKTAAARYDGRSYKPSYLPPEGLNTTELKDEVWGPLQRQLGALHPVPELLEVDLQGEYLKELQDMGYVGQDAATPPKDG